MASSIKNLSQTDTLAPHQSQLETDKPVASSGSLVTLAIRENDSEQIDGTAASDRWWAQSAIDTVRWNKMYPFQLLLVSKEGQEGKYKIQPGWKFTLPLPPESLIYSMPFAINTQITQGGVNEEHNGIPLRSINFRGSTGYLPLRGSSEQPNSLNFFQTIAGGTISALNAAEAGFQDASAGIQGLDTKNPNVRLESEFETSVNGKGSELAKSTGYYQFHRLKKFLEAYGTLKKTKEGQRFRLALALWKDKSVYLVTPLGLEVTKDASSPMEYRYNMSFKAWRRIELDTNSFVVRPTLPIRRDPNALARGLNVLMDARRGLQAIQSLPTAVIGDFERTVLNPLREATLFIKDALGATATLADMPDTVINSLKPALDQWFEKDFKEGITKSATNVTDRAVSQWNSIKSLTEKNSSQAATSRGEGQISRVRTKAKNPKDEFDFNNDIPLPDLPISPSLLAYIQKEIERVRNMTRLDFEILRDQIERTSALLAIALGAGNSTFEDTYNVKPQVRKVGPTESDFEAMAALDSTIAVFDKLAATADNQPSAKEDSINVMSQLYRRTGTAFNIPKSKFAVPMIYGMTLEGLAKRYLGDPSRWIEVAALNGLRAPYIDEEGYETSLVSNGIDSVVVVKKTNQLYINQSIHIGSKTTRRTRRRIVDLKDIGENTYITVDGDPTMGFYKTSEAAVVSAFLPDTVNSQQLVYIPSDVEPAEDNFVTKSIPGVDDFDPMVAVGGVDVLLDSNNDLIITPDGDTKLAVGLSNIIQNLRVALSINVGGLMGHPSFGLPFQVGMSNADFSAKDAIDAIRRMIGNDPTFSRVDGIQVRQSGPLASIDVAVVVNGTEQPIPISFEVAR